MQLKNTVKSLVVMGSIALLSACSAPGHKGQGDEAGADSYGANGGAQTSGVAAGSSFGDETGGAGPQQSLAKRTYYFDYDKSEIHEQDKRAISANANYLMAHSKAKIILEGHTDPRGSREYNVALGERRANAVADFMKEKRGES